MRSWSPEGYRRPGALQHGRTDTNRTQERDRGASLAAGLRARAGAACEGRRPHRCRHLGRERAADVPRRRRVVGGPRPDGRRDARGVRATIPTWCSGSTTSAAPRSAGSSPTPPTSPWPGSSSTSVRTSTWSPRTSTTCTSAAAPRGCTTCTAGCAPRWCTTCDQRHEWTGDPARPAAVPDLRHRDAAARRRLVRRGPLRHGRDAACAVRAATCSWRSAPPGSSTRLRRSCTTPSAPARDTLELNLAPDAGQRLRAGAAGPSDRDRARVGGGDAASREPSLSFVAAASRRS